MADFFHRLDEWDDSSRSMIHNGLRRPRRRLTIGLLGKWSDIFDESALPDPDVTKLYDEDELVTVELRKLAREITAIEEDIPVEQATGQKYSSVYTTLTQSHLPVLDEIGAIQYDSDRQIIRPGRNFVVVCLVACLTDCLTWMISTDTDSEEHPDSISHPEMQYD